MDTIHLYRKRYVPDEIVELKDDKVLYRDKDIIVTKWNILNPRPDINHGFSVYYMREGFKISKMYNAAHELVYWYCDIIDTEYNEKNNSYIFYDLLIDVLIYPDNHVEVVDLDEFADFTQREGLPPDMLAKALRQTDTLLKHIYNGRFDELTEPITSREKCET